MLNRPCAFNKMPFNMIFSMYNALSVVCLRFFFVSCKIFSNYLHEVNSEFHVNRNVVQSFMFCYFSYHLIRKKKFAAGKDNKAVKKGIGKASKIKYIACYRNNIDSHSIQ